jgi:hypothetical protein
MADRADRADRADQQRAGDAAPQRRRPRAATAAEVAALQQVYARLSDLLTALREARAGIRNEDLLAAVNAEIDRQLAADDALRRALEAATGRPVQDPY